jgi:hypothetical protein
MGTMSIHLNSRNGPNNNNTYSQYYGAMGYTGGTAPAPSGDALPAPLLIERHYERA